MTNRKKLLSYGIVVRHNAKISRFARAKTGRYHFESGTMNEENKPPTATPVHGIVRLPDTAPLAAYEKDGITIYRGESLNVLRQLPDAICDCVITDPPYSSGGLFRGDRSGDAAQKYVGWNNSDKKQYGTFGGDSRDQRSFFAWASLWLAESWRIAKPGAQCYVFTDWRQLPVVTDAVQAGGWTWRGLLVWDKGVGRPMKGRYRNHLEYVVWCSNGAMPEADDIYPSTLLHVPTVPRCDWNRDRSKVL
jgi:DNA modification methylase